MSYKLFCLCLIGIIDANHFRDSTNIQQFIPYIKYEFIYFEFKNYTLHNRNSFLHNIMCYFNKHLIKALILTYLIHICMKLMIWLVFFIEYCFNLNNHIKARYSKKQ